MPHLHYRLWVQKGISKWYWLWSRKLVSLQNNTTKWSTFPINVFSVFSDTSSMTSSSSPVDLFSISHSSTSSSRDSSPIPYNRDKTKTKELTLITKTKELYRSNNTPKPHTLVDDGNLMAVVDQLWQHAQIVLVGQLLIVDLHEANVQLIRLVVNIFQLLQSLLALFALGFV